LDTDIFEWETRLAVEKGLKPNTSRPPNQDQNKLSKGNLIRTLAVKLESSVSKVVHSEVVHSEVVYSEMVYSVMVYSVVVHSVVGAYYGGA